MRNLSKLAGVGVTLGLAGTVSAQTFTNGGVITIPAGAPATTSGNAGPYPSAITVAGLTNGGNLTDVNATLTTIQHTFASDIDAVLVGPTGVAVILFSDIGGSTGFDVAASVTLDDAAAAALGTSTITTGTYKPTNTAGVDTFPAPGPGALTQVNPLLANFNNTNGNGTWSLYIVDDVGGDVGTVGGGWGITLTTGGNNCLLALPHPWCITDVNNDNSVNVTDLLAVIAGWGQSGPPRPAADIAPGANGDCTVNVTDLLAVIGQWGACPAPTGACCPPGGGAGTCTSISQAACDALGGTYGGTGSACPASCPATPLNDNPGGAFAVTPGVYPAQSCTANNSTNATLTSTIPNPACTFGGPANFTRDVWFKYTIPNTVGLFGQILRLDTCTNVAPFTDTTLAVYTGTPPALTEVACNDDECGNLRSRVQTGILTPGSQVYIRLGSWGTGATNQGAYNLCMSAEDITQDDCLGAETIAVGASDTDNLFNATQDYAPTCQGQTTTGVTGIPAGVGKWYKITSATNQTLTASTCSSVNGLPPNSGIYNCKLTVYCGVDCGSLLCRVATDADQGTPQLPACPAFQGETVSWGAAANRTYWLMVHADPLPTGENAPYTLTLTGVPLAVPPTETCGPPPPPANDLCTGSTAMVLGANAFMNVGATNDTTASCATITRDVWYTYAVPASGCSSITLNTVGTTGAGGWGTASPDTVLQVFGGTCGSLTSLQCNDDFTGLGLLSQVTVPVGTPAPAGGVTPGSTIIIRVGSWGSGATNQGTGNVNIICNP